MLQLARSGVKDAEFALFQRNVRADIDRGADPTVAADTRARGLVQRAAHAASRQSSVATSPTGYNSPSNAFRGYSCVVSRRSAPLLALSAWPCAAQQVDTLQIPAKSKYILESFAGKRPLTRAERTNFTETSHYDDVVAFIDSLKKLGAKIATGSIGKTIEGRELPYVIASRPLDHDAGRGAPARPARSHTSRRTSTPAKSKAKKRCSRCFAICCSTRSKNVLDSIVLIVQPIYNADGNEKWGPQARNRGAQNGPELVGTRQNASGWNLNRDYIGADAPETKGAFAMLNKWNPDLFMDLHTTDGSHPRLRADVRAAAHADRGERRFRTRTNRCAGDSQAHARSRRLLRARLRRLQPSGRARAARHAVRRTSRGRAAGGRGAD